MMESNAADTTRGTRYEPNEQPPHALALELGFQRAMLAGAGIVVRHQHYHDTEVTVRVEPTAAAS